MLEKGGLMLIGLISVLIVGALTAVCMDMGVDIPTVFVVLFAVLVVKQNLEALYFKYQLEKAMRDEENQ